MHTRVTHRLRFVAMALTVIFASASFAQVTPAPTGFLPIAPAQPTASGDKVEVIEVFSYGCIHCKEFQPYVDAWTKRYDKATVQFTYLPATFNTLFQLMARGYYAADSLGVSASTHQRVYDALFVDGKQVNNLETLADLYGSLGVNRTSFLKAAQSFLVESQLRRANELERAYAIDGTPTVVVAGKYRVTGDSAGGNDKVFAVVDALVAKERKNARPIARTP